MKNLITFITAALITATTFAQSLVFDTTYVVTYDTTTVVTYDTTIVPIYDTTYTYTDDTVEVTIWEDFNLSSDIQWYGAYAGSTCHPNGLGVGESDASNGYSASYERDDPRYSTGLGSIDRTWVAVDYEQGIADHGINPQTGTPMFLSYPSDYINWEDTTTNFFFEELDYLETAYWNDYSYNNLFYNNPQSYLPDCTPESGTYFYYSPDTVNYDKVVMRYKNYFHPRQNRFNGQTAIPDLVNFFQIESDGNILVKDTTMNIKDSTTSPDFPNQISICCGLDIVEFWEEQEDIDRFPPRPGMMETFRTMNWYTSEQVIVGPGAMTATEAETNGALLIFGQYGAGTNAYTDITLVGFEYSS